MRIVFLSLSSLLFSLFIFQKTQSKDLQKEHNYMKTNKYDDFEKTPAWVDEFNTDGKPDPAIWSYDTGGHGWGNHEKQTYTEELKNAEVKNGMLQISCFKEASDEYSSARLKTKGKRDFLYGRMEVKAKIPKGRGTWPAIWTLASQSDYGQKFWPDNGELDIMEHVGMDQNLIHSNIHTKAFNHTIKTNKGNNQVVPGVSDDFHVYILQWTPDLISFYVDDQLTFEFKKEESYGWAEWPFDKPQHLLLNIAVGGDWGGQKGIDDSVFPQQMQVDYVRYYPLKK